jgi:hypothetical protein
MGHGAEFGFAHWASAGSGSTLWAVLWSQLRIHYELYPMIPCVVCLCIHLLVIRVVLSLMAPLELLLATGHAAQPPRLTVSRTI